MDEDFCEAIDELFVNLQKAQILINLRQFYLLPTFLVFLFLYFFSLVLRRSLFSSLTCCLFALRQALRSSGDIF